MEKIKSDYASQAKKGSISFGTIPVGKQSFVVMGITSELKAYKWIGAGATAGAVAGAVIGALTPIGWVAGAIFVGIAGGAAGAGATEIDDLTNTEVGGITVEGVGVENQFMSPTIIEANSDKFKALNCEEILTLS